MNLLLVSMIYPLQSPVSSNDGSLFFCTVKNMIQVFKWESALGEFTAIGQWIDDLHNTKATNQKDASNDQHQVTENESKRQKINEGEAQKPIFEETEKASASGQGPSPAHRYIRNMALSRDEKLLFACTDSDKAVVTFELDYNNTENCLKLKKRQPLPKRPNALTTTVDDKAVLVADKFGDVYALDVSEEKVPEGTLDPILGHVSLLTDIAVTTDSDGKQLVFTADRDEHIRITHYPQTYIINKWLFGSKQFVSTLCLAQWGPELLFSAGGDSFVHSWNWKSGELLDSLDISDFIEPHLGDAHLAPEKFQNETNSLIEYAVAKIISFSELPYIAFFVEQTKVLFICKVDPTLAKITLAQKIELPFTIVSLTSASSANEIIATLDNRDPSSFNYAAFISYDGTEFTVNAERNNAFEKCIEDELNESQVASIESDESYPLYNIASLRKRGEHFA